MNMDYVNFNNQVTPPSILYKYRELNSYTLRSLSCNEVYFSKLKDFNDPFETEKLFFDTEFSKQVLPRNLEEAGVLCLCESVENLPMWAYYGNGLKGFVIGYDIETFLNKNTLKPVTPSAIERIPRGKYVYKVEYHDRDFSPINENSLINGPPKKREKEKQKMFATKAKAFKHEDEWRIVVEASPRLDPPRSWQGFGLYMHDINAIKEIIFGELISSEDERVIKKLMSQRQIVFKRARRVKNTYRIELENA
jgi:Protein of unknown function (DUF2971)